MSRQPCPSALSHCCGVVWSQSQQQAEQPEMAPQVCCFCGTRRHADRPCFRQASSEELARAAAYRAARVAAGLPVRPAAALDSARHVCIYHTARKQQIPPQHSTLACSNHEDDAAAAAAMSLLLTSAQGISAAEHSPAAASEERSAAADAQAPTAASTIQTSVPPSTSTELPSHQADPHHTAAAAGRFHDEAAPLPAAECRVGLREISPGADNHCLFHAVAAGLGGRTHSEMRALLRQGVDRLDSVHLLARYDLILRQGDDPRVAQHASESADAYARRQQRQLRQFQASYSKRTVFRDLSSGGTPELFLLSHALGGSVVFLVYNGLRMHRT
jgi:hypothetical protein